MTWYMNNKVFDPTEEDIKSFHGFVYCITEIDTGKKYIGKKFFWRSKILPVTKTRKRRKRTLVESDWKKYYGSNETLKERVVEGSETNYKREIIKLCRTKGDCSYHEARLQFENGVLLDDNYYNNFVGCKIHSRHLTKE